MFDHTRIDKDKYVEIRADRLKYQDGTDDWWYLTGMIFFYTDSNPTNSLSGRHSEAFKQGYKDAKGEEELWA